GSAIKFLLAVALRSQFDGLLVAHGEYAEHGETRVKEPMSMVLKRLREVDHHVATGDHVELVERSIADEVMLSENDVLQERSANKRSIPLGDVIFGKGP